MHAILCPAAPKVKSTRVMTDAQFSAWSAALVADLDPEPTSHTVAEEIEWIGYQLGAAGIDADLPADLPFTPAEREAFAKGHDAGDTYLWTIDPDFAAHLKERAERSEQADALLAIDPPRDWHENEVIECSGRTI